MVIVHPSLQRTGGNVAKHDKDEVTLSTLNTRSGVKKKEIKSHSKYWLDMGEWEDDGGASTLSKAVRLASVQRAIGNFVRILTSDDKIAVRFNAGRESYTDGKTVTIAAQDNPRDFDVMVGLALHEASHCVLTPINFYSAFINPKVLFNGDGYRFLGVAANPSVRIGFSKFFHPTLQDVLQNGNNDEVRDLLAKLMMYLNIVEDRRIDQFVYNTAVGYRPYYGALYKKYMLSPTIDKALKGGKAWTDHTDVDSYVNRIINIMNENSKADALPGLEEMFNLFDVENIQRLSSYTPTDHMQKFMREVSAMYRVLESNTLLVHIDWDKEYILDYIKDSRSAFLDMPPAWILANDLLALTVKYSGYKFGAVMPPPPVAITIGGGEGDNESGEGDNESGEGDNESGEDNASSTSTEDIKQAARLAKAVKNQRTFINGTVRKTKIAHRLNEMVKSADEARAKIVEIGEKTSALPHRIPCIVIENVTKSVMMSDWCLFGTGGAGSYADYTVKHNAPYIKSGIRMGQMLEQRLVIRNDPTITHFTRQNVGKIDRRILSQLGMDIMNVFKRTRTDKYKPVTIYLSLDASGSMAGEKWGKVLTVATALSYLADKVPDINVVVMARGGSDVPQVAILHDSRKQKFHVGRQILELATAKGGTPESLCYEATLNYIINKENSTDVYFINFSDGEPTFSTRTLEGNQSVYFSGEPAVQHCRQIMNIYREAGVRIMSYFISTYNSKYTSPTFKRMYGDAAEFVDVQNGTQVLKTLQKLLSDAGGMESTFN